MRFRVLRRFFYVIIALPLLYVITGLIGAVISASPVGQPDVGQPETSPFFQPHQIQPHKTIGLLGGPIHYDIVLPLDDETRRYLGWLSQDLPLDYPGVRWIVIGWGARDFYTSVGTWGDVTAGATLAGATLKGITGDHSVMHVALTGDFLPEHQVKWLSIPQSSYGALLWNINDSFENGNQTAAITGIPTSDFNRFYPAHGRFHIFNTCNVWVGRMLRNSGVRFGIWTPTPQAVSLSYWLYHD